MSDEEKRWVDIAMKTLEGAGHAIRSVMACREGITDELLGMIATQIDKVVDKGAALSRE